MPDTQFQDGQGRIYASWLQDVNDTIYKALGAGKNAAAVVQSLGLSVVSTSGKYSDLAGLPNLTVAGITSGSIDGAAIGGTTPEAVTGTNFTSKADNSNVILATAAGASRFTIELSDSGANMRFTAVGIGYPLKLIGAGRVLVGGAVDDGVNALQVAGSVNINTYLQSGGDISAGGAVKAGSNSGNQIRLQYVANSIDAYVNGVGSALWLQQNTSKNVVIGNVPDNGSDALQVAGNVNASGALFINGSDRYGYGANISDNAANTTAGYPLVLVSNAGPTRMNLEFIRDNANGYQIQSVLSGTGGKYLSLNPNGGAVLVNTTTSNGVDTLQVNGSIASGVVTIKGSGSATTRLQFYDNAAGTNLKNWHLETSSGTLYFSRYDDDYASNGRSVLALVNAGRVLVNGATDNGTDALQVNGSMAASSGIVLKGYATGISGPGLEIGYAPGFGASGAGRIIAYDRSSGVYKPIFMNDGGGRVVIGTATDNGTDTLQVNGSTVTSGLNSTGYLRVTGSGTVPSSGVGIESLYDTSTLKAHIYAYSRTAGAGIPLFLQAFGSRLIVGSSTDNGTDALQVNGSTYSSDSIKSGGMVRATGLGTNFNKGGGSGPGVEVWYDTTNNIGVIQTYDRLASTYKSLALASPRVTVNTSTDNGSDALQVNGSAMVSGGFRAGASGIVGFGGTIAPWTDNAYTNGSSGYRWSAVWSVNGTVQTSDRTLKTDFADSLGLNFINGLNPVSYRWKENDNGVHQGLIAQEVDELLGRLGVESFAGLSKPDDAHLGLNYSEFIAPLIRAVQELSQRVKQLEENPNGITA